MDFLCSCKLLCPLCLSVKSHVCRLNFGCRAQILNQLAEFEALLCRAFTVVLPIGFILETAFLPGISPLVHQGQRCQVRLAAALRDFSSYNHSPPLPPLPGGGSATPWGFLQANQACALLSHCHPVLPPHHFIVPGNLVACYQTQLRLYFCKKLVF